MKKLLSIFFIFIMLICCMLIVSCNQTRIEDMVNISIEKLPDKLEYQFGEELDLEGLEVHLNYKKADAKILKENEYVVKGYDSQKEGDQTLEVIYKVQDNDYEIEFKQYFRVKVIPIKGDLYFTDDFSLDKVYDGLCVSIDENDYIKNSSAEAAISWYQGEILLLKAPKNVGKYSVVISIPSNEGFEAASISMDFEIFIRELEVVWVGENDSLEDFDFTYTGYELAPTAKVDTSIYGEKIFLNQEGKFINVGQNYISTCTMMVPNSNYVLKNTTCSFSIVKASSNVQFNSTANFEKTFDNHEAQINGYEFDGDGNVEIKWFESDTLLDTSPINSGNYIVEIQISESENYSASSIRHEYTISRKQIEINWLGEGDSEDDFTWVYAASYVCPSASCDSVLGFNFEIQVLGSANNAGEYTATASILNDTNNNFQIVNNSHDFIISKAEYDMSGITFISDSKVYNGQEQSLQIQGDLPTGLDGISVSVCYEGGAINVSDSNEIKAIFSTDSSNYVVPSDMIAYLTITKAEYDMSGITFISGSKVYNGQEQSLQIQGDLPTGLDGISVSVCYEGGATNVSDSNEIKAIFSTESSNYVVPSEMIAYLTITQATRELNCIMESITSDQVTLEYLKSILEYEEEDAILVISIDGGEFVEEDSFSFTEGSSITLKVKESSNYLESNLVTISIIKEEEDV